MAKPTENDWNVFRQIPPDEKCNVLYEYLFFKGNTMKDVADMLYGSSEMNDTHRISCITRCYGFDDKNGGRFKDLEEKGITSEDVMDFIQQYPYGVENDNGHGSVMREFLENRLNERNSANASYAAVNSKPSINFNQQSTGDTNFGNQTQTGQSGGDEVIGVVIIIAVILFILSRFVKSGSAATMFNVLECVFFYGGIISFIVSIVKRSVGAVWGFSVAAVLAGLGFGNWVDGIFLKGVVFLVVAIFVALGFRNMRQ